MTSHLESVTMSNNTSWTWNVLPCVAGALALGILFFAQGGQPEDDAAAEAQLGATPAVALRIAPPPQFAPSEPKLAAAKLPQAN